VNPLAGLALPPKPTLVVGGYGYRNAGDEAILAGLLEVIGRDGATVVSRSPAETAAIHGVRAVHPAGSLRAVASHPGIVIGGGGLFGRDMGRLGRLLPLAGLAASLGGREVALLGVGIDRAMPASTARLVGALARRASLVVVRDEASREAAAGLGVAAIVRPDLSSAVPSAGRAAGVAHLRAAGLDPDRRPVVGLCLTAVDADLAAAVIPAVEALVDRRPDLDVCLLPMSRHPFVSAHDDEVLGRLLQARRPRLHLVRPPEEPSVLLGVFEAFGAAVCMRYHSLLFAERAGIPIVPLAYAEKCRHWLAERSVDPLDLGPATLVAAVDRALSRAAA
jgi:polysaccharide pyruvyl transferase WcaK-like protein